MNKFYMAMIVGINDYNHHHILVLSEEYHAVTLPSFYV